MATKDAIIHGVHGYMPDEYVMPEDPVILDRLEWFKDQKLGIMMHWGIYSQMGILESWALSDEDSVWSRKGVVDWMDWDKDGDKFKAEYIGLNKSFNPVRFQPENWAKMAAANGFKYLIFTTKHHDGFCMFDSKYSDYKVTAPDCPFSKNPKANIVKHVFDAFRNEGIPIAAYFSKPDWHHPDYWDDAGVGHKTTRMPTYDVEKNPERWERYRQFVENQMLELVTDYGRIEILWLDGGQVQRKCGLDIKIEDIIAKCRKVQPWVIAVDRTAGGTCENVITPECTVPPQPLAVPWESCITLGGGFSYRYDDQFKSPRYLIHLLIDIVAKGGNLALNIAPGPDGRLPAPGVARLNALGAWLRVNGEGIYATRVTPPYREDEWAFTASKDGSKVYAIRLWKEGETGSELRCWVANPKNIKKVVHIGSGREAKFRVNSAGLLMITFPEGLATDAYADVFRLEMK